MKYSDGFWMNKSGYDVNYATQIYEVKATDNSITVYATNQWIGNRGMTLGGPVLEITFTSTLADSIKVTIESASVDVKVIYACRFNQGYDRALQGCCKEGSGLHII